MHDTSFAEQIPVEGACDPLEFDGETAIRSGGEGVRRHRGVDSALLAGPVVADALVARTWPPSQRLASRRPRPWA